MRQTSVGSSASTETYWLVEVIVCILFEREWRSSGVWVQVFTTHARLQAT
jgi:hypothetical protein